MLFFLSFLKFDSPWSHYVLVVCPFVFSGTRVSVSKWWQSRDSPSLWARSFQHTRPSHTDTGMWWKPSDARERQRLHQFHINILCVHTKTLPEKTILRKSPPTDAKKSSCFCWTGRKQTIILMLWKAQSEDKTHQTHEPQNHIENLRLGKQVLSEFNAR